MITVFLADEHGGHKLGLCNPHTIMWDEGPDGEPKARKPEQGEVQRYLWRHYVKFLNVVKELANGEPIALINVGDLTHGIKHPDGLMTASVDDQTQIAFWNLKPWFDECNVKTCRLLVGTYAHTFDGSTEAIVTRLLRTIAPEADIKTVSHNLLHIGKWTFDVAHHRAGPGTRNWLKGNIAQIYLKSLMEDDLDHGRTPADFVIGAHYHTWIPPVTQRLIRGGKTYESTLILLPSWFGMSGYGRQATKSVPYIQHGLVAFDDGKIIPLIKELDLRTEEKVG